MELLVWRSSEIRSHFGSRGTHFCRKAMTLWAGLPPVALVSCRSPKTAGLRVRPPANVVKAAAPVFFFMRQRKRAELKDALRRMVLYRLSIVGEVLGAIGDYAFGIASGRFPTD